MDFDQIMTDISDMRQKIQELYDVVVEAKQASFISKHLGARTFTGTEKATLVSQYQALKAEAVTLFQKLP